MQLEKIGRLTSKVAVCKFSNMVKLLIILLHEITFEQSK